MRNRIPARRGGNFHPESSFSRRKRVYVRTRGELARFLCLKLVAIVIGNTCANQWLPILYSILKDSKIMRACFGELVLFIKGLVRNVRVL